MRFWSVRISHAIATAAIVTLAAINLFSDRLEWTGDEPRYTYYAAAIGTTHGFHMSDEQWNAFLSRFDLQQLSRADIAVAAPTLAHSPVQAVLASPGVAYFGVEGGRWLQLLVSGLAFFAVLRLLRTHVGDTVAAVATAFAFLSLPIQPYSRLLYAEAPSLLLVAVAWHSIRRPQTSRWSLPFTLLPVFALPFVHPRVAPIAMGLFLLWLYRIASEPALRPRRSQLFITTAGAALLAAVVFAAYQMTLFGSIIGGATAPEPLSLTRLPYRLGVQLFEFRHGLIANNPAMLLGFVGLAAAAYQGHRLAREGIVLFVLYLPFVVGAASEAMPGRFWVAVMPVLIAGLAFWLEKARSVESWVVALPLVFVSLQTSGLLVIHPNMFLENRLSSLTYEYLYRRGMGNVYFAPFLPWETFGLVATHDADNMRISHAFLVGTIVFGLLLTVGLTRHTAVRRVANGAALACLAWFLYLYSASPIAREQFSTAVSVTDDGRHQVVVTFTTPQSPRVITFGEPRPPWFPPAYPNELQVQSLETDGGSWAPLELVPTRPIIGVRRHVTVQAIRIVESNPTPGLWTQSPVSLLR